MNYDSYPNIKVNINTNKDPNQQDIPKNIFADIEIDREINPDEIIKLFDDSMRSHKNSLHTFMENEREFLYVLNKLKHFITPEQLHNINNSFSEVKKLLFDNANMQNEKQRMIYTWYKDNQIDLRSLVIVLFVLLVIIGIKIPRI